MSTSSGCTLLSLPFDLTYSQRIDSPRKIEVQSNSCSPTKSKSSRNKAELQSASKSKPKSKPKLQSKVEEKNVSKLKRIARSLMSAHTHTQKKKKNNKRTVQMVTETAAATVIARTLPFTPPTSASTSTSALASVSEAPVLTSSISVYPHIVMGQVAPSQPSVNEQVMNQQPWWRNTPAGWSVASSSTPVSILVNSQQSHLHLPASVPVLASTPMQVSIYSPVNWNSSPCEAQAVQTHSASSHPLSRDVNSMTLPHISTSNLTEMTWNGETVSPAAHGMSASVLASTIEPSSLIPGLERFSVNIETENSEERNSAWRMLASSYSNQFKQEMHSELEVPSEPLSLSELASVATGGISSSTTLRSMVSASAAGSTTIDTPMPVSSRSTFLSRNCSVSPSSLPELMIDDQETGIVVEEKMTPEVKQQLERDEEPSLPLALSLFPSNSAPLAEEHLSVLSASSQHSASTSALHFHFNNAADLESREKTISDSSLAGPIAASAFRGRHRNPRLKIETEELHHISNPTGAATANNRFGSPPLPSYNLKQHIEIISSHNPDQYEDATSACICPVSHSSSHYCVASSGSAHKFDSSLHCFEILTSGQHGQNSRSASHFASYSAVTDTTMCQSSSSAQSGLEAFALSHSAPLAAMFSISASSSASASQPTAIDRAGFVNAGFGSGSNGPSLTAVHSSSSSVKSPNSSLTASISPVPSLQSGNSSTPSSDNAEMQQSKRSEGNYSERPKRFFCQVCNKGFTQKGGLSNHERIHAGSKPFICFFSCGAAFAQKCNRTRHHRIHTGDCPYKCSVSGCERQFKRKAGLDRHTEEHRARGDEVRGSNYLTNRRNNIIESEVEMTEKLTPRLPVSTFVSDTRNRSSSASPSQAQLQMAYQPTEESKTSSVSSSTTATSTSTNGVKKRSLRIELVKPNEEMNAATDRAVRQRKEKTEQKVDRFDRESDGDEADDESETFKHDACLKHRTRLLITGGHDPCYLTE